VLALCCAAIIAVAWPQVGVVRQGTLTAHTLNNRHKQE
jgi:hypothetical protein